MNIALDSSVKAVDFNGTDIAEECFRRSVSRGLRMGIIPVFRHIRLDLFYLYRR